MSHPRNGERKSLSAISSSSLRFWDDFLEGKESPAEKRKPRRRQKVCSNDRFSRSTRVGACLLREKRHEEVPLSTVRSAGGPTTQGWSARVHLRGAKPRGAQTNTDRPARVWRERFASA